MAVMIETASDLASLIRGGDFQKLREQLVERRPPELAAALSELRADDQVIAFRILPRGLAAAVFEYMPPESQYSLLKAMERDARAVVEPAVGSEKLRVTRIADFRYVGQGHEIRVPLPEGPLKSSDGPRLRQAFEKLYRVLYGLIIPKMEIEAVTWSVTVSSTPPKVKRASKPKAARAPKPRKQRQVYDPDLGKLISMPVYWRFDMPAGARIKGPAIIAENETSTLIGSNFRARLDSLRIANRPEAVEILGNRPGIPPHKNAQENQSHE